MGACKGVERGGGGCGVECERVAVLDQLVSYAALDRVTYMRGSPSDDDAVLASTMRSSRLVDGDASSNESQ